MSIFLIYIFLILFISCENNSEPRIYKISKLESTDISIKENNKLNFTWETPSYLIERINTSSLRIASYSIPYNQLNADLSISEFPGDAGGIKANVNRWRKQLDLTELSLEELKKSAIIGD